jgi:hypothetical protein
LNGTRDDFFTKTDAALDQLIARYAEHVFKDAPSRLNDRIVSNSWKILGQGVVTSFVDVILFSLMWSIIPLRFLILLSSTPFKMLSQRSSRHEGETGGAEQHKEHRLAEPMTNGWRPDSFPSISEHTTRELESRQAERKRVAGRE